MLCHENWRNRMTDENDGGYYAIKGFLYQFDKTLIEIISNPDAHIGI
jgi:hypothetical protein